MQSELTAVLNKLHSGSFSDAKDISQSLSTLCLDQDLTPELIAFTSNKIFNSQLNLFRFAQDSIKQKDKVADQLRKNIYKLIGDYVKLRKQNVMDYVELIYTKSYQYFLQEEANRPKEMALRVIAKIVKHIENREYLEEIVKPRVLVDFLVLRIKTYKLVATVKGEVWHLLGLLYSHYSTVIEVKVKREIQDICLKELEKLIESDKNTTVIAKMLKSFNQTLGQNYLQPQLLSKLFKFLSVLILPLKDVYQVPRSALKTLTMHANLFHTHLLSTAKSIFATCLELMSHKNKDLKQRASDCMQAISVEIVKGISDSPQKYEQLYNHIMTTFWEIIKEQAFLAYSKEVEKKLETTVKMVSIIRTVGYFSPVILQISGKDQLKLFFHRLLEICDRKMIKAFESMDSQKFEGRWQAKNTFTMKTIMYRHKQIYSFIGSFARIIEHLDELTEAQAHSLQGLFLLAVRQYAFFYQKHIPFLLQAMVSLIISFSTKNQLFQKWLRKTIMSSLKQTLDTNRFMIAIDQDYLVMISKACTLWTTLIKHPKWTASTLGGFVSIFFESIEHLLKNLDISYRNVDQKQQQQVNEIVNVFWQGTEQLKPANISDYQYMSSLVLLFDEMVGQLEPDLYSERVFGLYTDILRRLKALPRSITLLKVCRTLNDFITRTGYFERINQAKKNQLVPCIKDLFNYLYENIGKYQSSLLYESLKVLMSTPIDVISLTSFKILKYQLPSVLIKSLDLGQQIPSLASSALHCLEYLFTSTERKRAVKYLSIVIPQLEKYISVKNELSSKENSIDVFLRELKVNMGTIMAETLRFLGRMGGLTHAIVPDLKNQEGKYKLQAETFGEQDQQTYISWDHDCTLVFPLPLINRKVDLKITKILPRVMQLMLNSSDQSIKVMACEFMHAVVIFIIGKSASDPKRNLTESQLTDRNNFKQTCSKIYSKILPSIFKVSCNPQHPSQQLMHTLSIQLIHFLSRTQQPNSPDIIVLLQLLIEMLSQSKDVSQFATRCLSELVKWSIKVVGTTEYPLVKMVVRNLWALTASKKVKEGTIQLLTQILRIIHKEEVLMGRYVLEFCSLLLMLSRNDRPAESSLLYLTEKLVMSMKPYIKLLAVQHPQKRTGRFSSIYHLLQWLYECGLFSNFSQQRTVSYLLWERILTTYKTFLETDVREFLFKRGSKETKTLFPKLQRVGFEGTEDLVGGCNKLTGYSELWNTLIVKGYFELDKLIVFNDFSELYMGSVAGFLSYLWSMSTIRGMLGQLQALTQQAQQYSLQCFCKVMQLLVTLLSNPQISDRIVANLLSRIKPDDISRLLITMLLKPHCVIKGVNSDVILMRYQGYFHNIEVVLKRVSGPEVGGKTLIELLHQQYRTLFQYIPDPKVTLLQLIIYHSDLYDSQLLLLLKGQSNLDNLLSPTPSTQHELSKVSTIVESSLTTPTSKLSNERCLMLIKFVLEHSSCHQYVVTSIFNNTQVYQKYEKYFLGFVARNWRDVGRVVVAEGVKKVQFVRVLLSLARLLTKEQYQGFFQWLPESDTKSATGQLLEQLIKLNFILTESTPKLYPQSYLSYCHNLTTQGLTPINALSLHQCSLNLLAQLLLNDTFKSSYLKHYDSLIRAVKNKYLPLRMSNLTEEKAKNQFMVFLKAFRNLVLISQEVTLFGTVLNVLRESIQGYFEVFLREMVENFVVVAFEKRESAVQRGMLEWAFGCFFDEKLDNNQYQNARVAIAQKLIVKLIQKANQSTCIELLDSTVPSLISILRTPTATFHPILNADSLCLQLSLKRSCFSLIESTYKKLPLKSKAPAKIHQKQLHKQIIKISHDSVKRKFQFQDMLRDADSKHPTNILPHKKCTQILREYCCAAYNCLIIVFINTQSKKEQFRAYLWEKKPGHYLWEQIIDTTVTNLGFEVETNFPMMKPIEPPAKSLSSKIKNRYCESSLFVIEEEYVPRTMQVDEQSVKMEIEQASQSVSAREEPQPPAPALELDVINRHPCMVNILTLIDFMQAQFSDGSTPAWMQNIYQQLSKQDLPISIRVFLIKLILNRPQVFTQQLWLPILLKYLGLKDTGSKFFHYFYRDVARQALSYHKLGYKSQGRLPCTALNKLLKMLPHQNGYLFTDNVSIFQQFLTFDKVFIQQHSVMQMLRFEEGKENYLDWRLNGVIVMKCALAARVPVLGSYEEMIQAVNVEERWRFFYKIYEGGMLAVATKMFEESKQKYSIAAAGFLAELVKFLTENPLRNIKEQVSNYVALELATASRSRNRTTRDRLAGVLNQMAQIYPLLIQQPKICTIVEDGLYNFTRKDRSLIIDCYIHLLQFFLKKRIPFVQPLTRICMLLRGVTPRLITDTPQVHHSLINLLSLLSDYTLLVNPNVYQMFFNTFELLDKTYSHSQLEEDSMKFYQVVIRIDDFLQGNLSVENWKEFAGMTRRTLVSGMAARFRQVRGLVFRHFEEDKREFPTPSQRLLALCEGLFVPDYEELWVTSAVPLIISLAKKSSDYDRLLFEESLDKLANYIDWDFRKNFRDNASQPYTPAYTLISQAMRRDGASVLASQTDLKTQQFQGMLRASQNSYLLDQQSPVFTMDNISSQSSQFSQSPSLGSSHAPSSSSPTNPNLLNIFRRTNKRKHPSEMSEFLSSNAISYNKITVVGDNRIRFNKVDAQAGAANYEEAINRQTELYLKRVSQKNARGMLVRKYKLGELPDIQIAGKDIVDPMMLLAFNDSELASELFGLLFQCICRTDNRDVVKHFRKLIPSLLSRSTKHTFSFTATLQKSLITLMRQTQSKIQFNMLQVAQKSNSYQYSVLFVQQNLIQISDDANNQSNQKSLLKKDIQVCEQQLNYWIDLMQLYHHLYQTDQVQGILLRVMASEQRSKMLQVINSKSKGLITEAKKNLEELFRACTNRRIRKFIEDEKIDCETLLSNWEEVNKELSQKREQLTDTEIKLLITAMVSTMKSGGGGDDVGRLKQMAASLSMNRLYYQQAVLSLACKSDVDKPKYFEFESERYFSREWDKLSSFAIRSKHQLLQLVQRNYQLKQFLTLYSKIDISLSDCRDLFKNWTQRTPSPVHDSHLNWLQLLQGRILFCNLMSDRYGLPQQLVNAATTDWFVQVGGGMVKKGLLGGAQTLIKKAIIGKRASKVFPWEFYKSTAKLKLKQLMVQHQPVVGENALVEFQHMPNVINKEMAKYQDISAEVKLKMNLLTVRFYQAFLDIYTGCVSDPKVPQQFIYIYSETIDKAFKLLRSTCVSDLIKRDGQLKLKRKTFTMLTVFSQRLLTLMSEPFEVKSLTESLATKKITAQAISSVFAQCLIKSLQLVGVGRDDQATSDRTQSSTDMLSSLILKLLKVVQKHPESLGDIFISAINQKKIPVWLFLYFLPQFISVLSMQCSRIFQDLFLLISQLYPQSLLYQFNSQFQRRHNCPTQTSLKLYDLLHESHPTHFLFIEALDHLTHPELRLKDTLTRLREKDTQRDALCEMEEMVRENQYYGKYNRKYAEDRRRKLERIGNMVRENNREWVNEVEGILKSEEMRNPKIISRGYLTLSDFSTFFEEYAANDWPRILLPGQYNTYGQQPLAQTKITIQSFDQSIFALSSLRRPKRLTIYGNNQKKYMVLVKGGEDLRLDQRIEQLFGVINRIMGKNCECEKRELFLKKFEVTPMKRWMGVLEWVDSTQVLREFVEREFREVRDPAGDLITKNSSFQARNRFLETLSGETERIAKHKPLLFCDQKQIVSNLKKCQFLMPYGLLRRALQRLSNNYDSYLHLKNRFICNYAVASVTCYLLGVGDRHLDNFLIHIPTATVILIDFGYSFGASLDLPLPQLVPFRLTKMFRELMDPIGVNGIFKSAMVHSLAALRSKWHGLADFCEVFVNDPVLDWTVIARKKKVIRTVVGNAAAGSTASLSQELSSDQQFFKKKIQYVFSKLQGKNPRLLLSQAIMDSKHREIPGIKKMIEGGKQLKPMVSAGEQADILIQLATDKNLLGRMFTPWCPYV